MSSCSASLAPTSASVQRRFRNGFVRQPPMKAGLLTCLRAKAEKSALAWRGTLADTRSAPAGDEEQVPRLRALLLDEGSGRPYGARRKPSAFPTNPGRARLWEG